MSLDDMIRRIAREEALRVVAARGQADVYTSVELPPDCPSRRAFRAFLQAQNVAGAAKNGKMWLVPRSAWHAARARVAAKNAKLPRLRIVPTAPAATKPSGDVSGLASQFLAANGFQRAKR